MLMLNYLFHLTLTSNDWQRLCFYRVLLVKPDDYSELSAGGWPTIPWWLYLYSCEIKDNNKTMAGLAANRALPARLQYAAYYPWLTISRTLCEIFSFFAKKTWCIYMKTRKIFWIFTKQNGYKNQILQYTLKTTFQIVHHFGENWCS